MKTVISKRIFELDLLRGVAVILVLFRHFHSTDYKIRIPVLENIGWIGVDLFFVLSGFLISSILYNEIDKKGSIDFKKFFIRRGFKIYPSFYFLILFTITFKFVIGKDITGNELLSECLFLQSYLKGMLVHTWSLGIEEHFYILLPVLLILRLKYSDKKISASFINYTFLIIAAFCLIVRCYNVFFSAPEMYKNIFNTHIRIDSLFFGVFVSYHFRYNHSVLKEIIKKYYVYLVLFCFFAFTLPYYFDVTSKFITSIGFTILYISFGMLLLLVLFSKDIIGEIDYSKTAVFKIIAFVGFHSYTIYLWHIPVEGIINRLDIYYKCNIYIGFFIYFLLSIGVGVLTAKLIEFPVLKIRDKYFNAD